MSNGSDTAGRGMSRTDELTRFGILVIVLIGVVLIVAVARPLIFDHIIPVLLGDGIETAPPRAELAPINPEPAAPEELVQPEVEEPVTVEAYPVTAEEEAAEAPPEAYPAPVEEAQVAAPAEAGVMAETVEEDAAQAEPPIPQSVSHIVTTGETLTSIADRYGTTVNDILAVNSLVSPNRINSGDTIIVPLP